MDPTFPTRAQTSVRTNRRSTKFRGPRASTTIGSRNQISGRRFHYIVKDPNRFGADTPSWTIASSRHNIQYQRILLKHKQDIKFKIEQKLVIEQIPQILIILITAYFLNRKNAISKAEHGFHLMEKLNHLLLLIIHLIIQL